jgi:hypothetical protein
MNLQMQQMLERFRVHPERSKEERGEPDTSGVDLFDLCMRDIATYHFAVSVPPVQIPVSGDRAERMVNQLYDRIVEINEDAGFHFPQHLEIVRVNTSEEAGIGVKFGDDEYDYQVLMMEGRILVQRRGSALGTFVDWYARFMPSARQLVDTAMTAIMEDTGVDSQPISVTHGFEFILYDLRTPDGAELRNWNVVKRLISNYPDERGRIAEAAGGDEDEGGSHVARVDFDVCRWIDGPDGQRVQCWYGVEAPANKLWSTLQLNLRVQGQAYKSPWGGQRTDFDSARFLGDYEFPLIGFLRDRALDGFARSLLDGVRFTTTTARIP